VFGPPGQYPWNPLVDGLRVSRDLDLHSEDNLSAAGAEDDAVGKRIAL